VAKVPRRPHRPVPDPVGPERVEIPTDRPLFRVYRSAGRHATTWARFRTFGAARVGRFDHHPLPRGEDPDRRILYAAVDVKTAIAEAFGDERVIDRRRDEPYVARFRLAGRVLALDLASDWPTRAGGSQGSCSGPRPTSQAWSRAIWEDLDGIAALLYPSSMHGGGTNICFYERAEPAIPRAPDRNLPLSLPAFERDLIRLATELGYGIR
jgi:RES domain-containing protein